MSAKIRIIFICGVAVALLPLTGFPDSWRNFFGIIAGIIVCVTTYLLHRAVSGKSKISKLLNTEAFTENSLKQG